MILRHIAKALLIQAMAGVLLTASPSSEDRHQRGLNSYRKHTLIAIRLSRQGNQNLLLSESKNQVNPVHRITYAYGLLRLNPKANGNAFLDAFPEKRPPKLDLSDLDMIFPEEDKAPKFPGDKHRFSYWSIMNALISLAKQGNERALRIWLSYTGGWGGAEYIEGNLADLATMFYEAPAAVVHNWTLFRESTTEIYINHEKPKFFQDLRKRYLQFLPAGHPHRKEVLALIDRLEKDANQ